MGTPYKLNLNASLTSFGQCAARPIRIFEYIYIQEFYKNIY